MPLLLAPVRCFKIDQLQNLLLKIWRAFHSSPTRRSNRGKSRPMLFVSRNDRPWHDLCLVPSEKKIYVPSSLLFYLMKVWNAPKKTRRFNMNMAKLSCLKQRLPVTNMSNFLLVILLMAPFLRQLRLLPIPANTKKNMNMFFNNILQVQ